MDLLLSHLWRRRQEEEEQGPGRRPEMQEKTGGGKKVPDKPLPGRLQAFLLGSLVTLFSVLWLWI